MSTWVSIDGLVDFSPNNGVSVHPEITELSAVEIKNLLALAFHYVNEPTLKEACHGQRGPLAGMGQVDFDDFLRLIRAKKGTPK